MSFPYRIHAYLRAMRGRKSSRAMYATTAPSEKEYPRMRRIALPLATMPMTLHEALEKRSSATSFDTTQSLSFEHLGSLLGHSLRMREDGRRAYPSGGGHYPLETYVITRRVEKLDSGAYHYHPRTHTLEHLWDIPIDEQIIESSAPDMHTAAAFIVFTGIWERTYEKYGDFAYLLGLLEAGHMAQNILLSSVALSVIARPLEGFADETLTRAPDLGVAEQVAYVIALGTAPVSTTKKRV